MKNDPDRVADSLQLYTANTIRASRDGGFVDDDNAINALGTPHGLPARRSDAEYGRVLDLTNKYFFKSLCDGRDYLFPDRAKARAHFSLFEPASRTPRKSDRLGFDDYCQRLRAIAGTSGLSPSSKLSAQFPELDQIFLAYRGYVLAIEDKKSGVSPYEPAWVTPWQLALDHGLDPGDLASWYRALGVFYSYNPGEPPLVCALLKYRIPPGYTLYRPTCLEAGPYSLHYPTHCGLGTPHPAVSGHTMNCDVRAKDPSLKEWIHLQCPIYSTNLVSLELVNAAFPAQDKHLMKWRTYHFARLTREYPASTIPPSDFI